MSAKCIMEQAGGLYELSESKVKNKVRGNEKASNGSGSRDLGKKE